MKKLALTGFAAAAILSGATVGLRAEPASFAASAPSAAAGPARLVREAVNVCGSNGCAPVQMRRVQHRKAVNVPPKHS